MKDQVGCVSQKYSYVVYFKEPFKYKDVMVSKYAFSSKVTKEYYDDILNNRAYDTVYIDDVCGHVGKKYIDKIEEMTPEHVIPEDRNDAAKELLNMLDKWDDSITKGPDKDDSIVKVRSVPNDWGLTLNKAVEALQRLKDAGTIHTEESVKMYKYRLTVSYGGSHRKFVYETIMTIKMFINELNDYSNDYIQIKDDYWIRKENIIEIEVED